MAPFSFALTLDEKKVFGDLVLAAASLERRPVVQPPALKGVEELPDAVDDMPALVWVPLPPPITTSAASSSKAKPKGKGKKHPQCCEEPGESVMAFFGKKYA